MARPLRLQFPGGIYHVTARGNDRQAIFSDDADRSRFLIVLASVIARYRVRCHAYCLMGNHYHLLLETPDANLSVAMRQLNGVYTQRFNRRHERCGHVLQGRFGAALVGRHAHLHEVCRYIVLNPVRAGLVSHPRDWVWSSFRATAGQEPIPGFLSVEWVRALSGASSPVRALQAYVRFVEAGLAREDAAELDRIGSEHRLVPEAQSHLTDAPDDAIKRCVEIPRAQRFATRPSLRDLFRDVTTRRERDTRAVAAVREHGYSMREVGDFLGRHYITVSRALARADGLRPTEKMSECKT
ncbi:MAG TPA: transposase [Methylomirabilota bacterium]|jgi:REP element-mobilizing transposase RayT